ncbi:hypothetical protein AX14_009136 [Amanita brunnescens Koide BX004]|nr:hypothetical protein AX14_009136 [Amanita brunnescens Koide BX004]
MEGRCGSPGRRAYIDTCKRKHDWEELVVRASVLQRVVTSVLNPLKVCSSNVVMGFQLPVLHVPQIHLLLLNLGIKQTGRLQIVQLFSSKSDFVHPPGNLIRRQHCGRAEYILPLSYPRDIPRVVIDHL